MAPRLDKPAVADLISRSRLFDETWYAAQAGASFGSRSEAIDHWVRQAAPEASPHPLFEPAWLYSGGRWRGKAPDPLSFYLARPDTRARTPHPLYDQATLGDLETWLADHDPTDLLKAPAERSRTAEATVVVAAHDLRAAVSWMRHLHRVSPDATGLVVVAGIAERRILDAVAAPLPSIRVQRDDRVESPVRVDVAAGVRPPRWAWLPDLLASLERPGVAAAEALLLADDFTVTVPLLVGHPIADAVRLDGLPLPRPSRGVRAVRLGASGDLVLSAQARLLGPPDPDLDPADPSWAALWSAAGFGAPGQPLTVREGRRALRWSIDIAAGAGRTRWGDFHFASSLAAALDRLGQWVAIDHPQTRDRATRELDDVVLTIRGLERVIPPAHTANMLWVISHPDDVDADEVAAYGAAFAASTSWADSRSRDWGLKITPLLHCTDTTRFYPGVEGEPRTGILFVANARHQFRPSVAAAIEADTPLTVYGYGWDAWLPSGRVTVAAESVPNQELPALYAGADLVLNDHWEDMRGSGFVSNRVFDVLATGARLLSDDVVGLADVVGAAVPTWRDADEFARLTTEPFEHLYPDAPTRQALAEHVVAAHSFDARAAALLETAYRLVDSRR